MEDIIQVDDQLIANTLAKPRWPWIIALAYSAEDRAPGAIAKVISALERYDEGRISKIATGMALKELNKLICGDASKSDWSGTEEFERLIVQAIESDDLASFGRKKRKSPLQPLDPLLWAGGEIMMYKTSDLKPEGERKSDNPTFARQNPTWYYDIHVSAIDVKKLLDRETPPALRGNDRRSAPPTKKRPTKQHGYLFTFLRVMTDEIRDGTRLEAHAAYVRWLKRDRPREKPFARTAFEGMLEHYKDGWSIKDNEWVLE